MKFLWGLNPFKYFLGVLAIGLAIAFPRYWNHWVYFPSFPNALDSMSMALVGTYLLYLCVAEVKGRRS